MNFKIASLTIIAVLTAAGSAIAQAPSDWRFFRESADGNEFINIQSVRKTGSVYEFENLETSSKDRSKSYSKIRVNCAQNYIDYVSGSRVSNGTTTDVTSVLNLFDGIKDYVTRPYCNLFNGGNLAAMPKNWTPSVSNGGGTGRCNVPSDLDSRGRRCGGRAASERQGGR